MQFDRERDESNLACNCCGRMRLLRAAVAVLAASALLAAPAAARTVHFQGRSVAVPADWPVYRLADHPRMCVRMDRRAVYLGTPGSSQRCRAGAIGRTRAILVAPGTPARASGQGTGGFGHLSSDAEFTGLGFDACATPSSRTMAAWASSPYRGIGVYIGGANRACTQPNLTSAWVGEQVLAGWNLIPTYVGLQAPTSSCGSCARLSTTLATPQGAASARDAVAQAQSVGIGPGSPVYFDMEAYTRTSSATKATLAFLAAWTSELHALGYASGVYSSSSSGIADLASQYGSSYPLPDDVWTANWNGAQNTLDPYLPAEAWANHQRLHQYRGGHNETYGGVTINIDNDYVEGATVGAAAPSSALPPLTVRHVHSRPSAVSVWVRCGWAEGESCPGHIVLRSAGAGVGNRAFKLGGGKAHSFILGVNSRGRSLLARRGFLRAQLLVAIPGARATRAVRFSGRR
jgi:hypothetical protein